MEGVDILIYKILFGIPAQFVPKFVPRTEKGYIEVENRRGIIEQFPLTSVSIGVVISEEGRFNNILEIGEVGAQVKHVAKSIQGSSYAVDRRKKSR